MAEPPSGPGDEILRQARDALQQAGRHERRMMTVGLVCAALLAAMGIGFTAFGAAPQLLGERVEAEVADDGAAPGGSGTWVRFEDVHGRVVHGEVTRTDAATVTVWYAPAAPEQFQDAREILWLLAISTGFVVAGAALGVPIRRSRQRVTSLAERIERDLHPDRRQQARLSCEVRWNRNDRGPDWSTVLLYDDQEATRWRFKSRLTRSLQPVDRVPVTVHGRLEPYAVAVVELDDGSLLPLPEGLLPPLAQRLRHLFSRGG